MVYNHLEDMVQPHDNGSRGSAWAFSRLHKTIASVPSLDAYFQFATITHPGADDSLRCPVPSGTRHQQPCCMTTETRPTVHLKGFRRP